MTARRQICRRRLNGKKKIMHGKISIDGEVLMASDAPPGHFHQPQGFRSR